MCSLFPCKGDLPRGCSMLIICLFSSQNRWVGQDARGSKSARQVLAAIVNCAETVLWIGAIELERFSKVNPWRSQAVMVRDSVQSFAQPPDNGLIDKPWSLDNRLSVTLLGSSLRRVSRRFAVAKIGAWGETVEAPDMRRWEEISGDSAAL